MVSLHSQVFRRFLSNSPTSHFITLPNRPIVQSNGQIIRDNLKLHYWEWKGHLPTILFCHAASFHARCYDRIINEALNGHHVISLDFRGHGRSQQHPPPYRFHWFGEDVLEFIEKSNIPKGNLIGIGHSVGGYALTYAAAKASRQLFKSLLLLDPVIFFPEIYGNTFILDNFNVDYVLRRKSQYASVDEMFSRLENRPSFANWPKDTLRSYCENALDENGKLVCSPEGEASIYKTGAEAETNVFPLIEQSKFIQNIPVHIVRATVNDFSQLESSPTNPELVQWFKKGRDVHLEDSKHLFPMVQPELSIDLVKQFINENNKLNSSL